MKHNFDKAFQDMDKVFQDMDKIFKQVDKIMDQVQQGPVARKTVTHPWKAWFAWRPVKIKGKNIWMKKVYRRKINTYVDMEDWTRYEYGDMFDVLKEAGK